MSDWIEHLESFGACQPALEWCRDQPDQQTAWNKCKRGDWMIWLLSRLSLGPRSKSRRTLVIIVIIACGGERPLKAIETAEAAADAAAYAAAYVAARADAAGTSLSRALQQYANIVRKHVSKYPSQRPGRWAMGE